MNASYRIQSGTLSAAIDPFGAELVSLQDAAGREYLWQGDRAWWSGQAPILFPIVGALNGGGYRLGSREYALEKHGFARRSAFVCEEHEPYGWARFALVDDAAIRAVYPFVIRLELLFEIEGTTLSITATVTNKGPETLPFSFGFHPAFAWPLPGGGDKATHRVVFEHPEPSPIERLDADGLLAREDASPVVGNILAPTAEMFADDALVLTGPHSRRARFEGANGAGLDLAWPDCPDLGVWQKPGADFLCIEPWYGHSDPAGFEGDFRDKPGIVLLPPGKARQFRLAITVTPPLEEQP